MGNPPRRCRVAIAAYCVLRFEPSCAIETSSAGRTSDARTARTSGVSCRERLLACGPPTVVLYPVTLGESYLCGRGHGNQVWKGFLAPHDLLLASVEGP